MLGKVTKYEHKRKVISKVMDKSMRGGHIVPPNTPPPPPPPPYVK